MVLSDYLHSFGQAMRQRHGQRVHKLALDIGMTCPNRDASKGIGGCTFCNNASFSPAPKNTHDVARQIDAGRQVIAKRTGARRFLAYFQSYSNTYAELGVLRPLYEQALQEPDVIGLAVGTRPDCVSAEVLDLLMAFQQDGYEVWLELGLQSSFNHTLTRVNRAHDWQSYRDTVRAARARGLRVCTHLIIGLPGETRLHALTSLRRVIMDGVDGLKLHPLHVVKGTQLARDWHQGRYTALSQREYIAIAVDLIERTPPQIIFHRISASASPSLLLAPPWCAQKWPTLNAIEAELKRRGSRQGSAWRGARK